jgi:hypothetical protein
MGIYGICYAEDDPEINNCDDCPYYDTCAMGGQAPTGDEQ